MHQQGDRITRLPINGEVVMQDKLITIQQVDESLSRAKRSVPESPDNSREDCLRVAAPQKGMRSKRSDIHVGHPKWSFPGRVRRQSMPCVRRAPPGGETD